MPRSGQVRDGYRLLAPALLVLVTLALVAVVHLSGAGEADLATAEDRASRAPAPPRPRPQSLTIGWVGDTVLGSRHGVPPNSGRDLLLGLRPLLRRPDLMIGNLEGTIGTRGPAKCPLGTPNCFAFQAPPSAARTLKWAGFDLLNLANNHANDYGPVGLADTRRHLKAVGVASVGSPGQITVVPKRGISVATIGFASYPWTARLDDIDEAIRLVRRARRAADVVVVVMHAGAEGADQTHTPLGPEMAYGEVRGDTRAFAHAVVDAGADIVLGSGPHVIRGVELRHGSPIVYSTGNFVGYHTFPTAGVLGLAAMVQVTVDSRGRVRRGRWTPLRLQPPGRPEIDSTRAATALAADLSSSDFDDAGLLPSGRLRSTTVSGKE